MVMIMVVVVMGFGTDGAVCGGSGVRLGLGIRIWIRLWQSIRWRRASVRWQTAVLRGKSGPCFRFVNGDATHPAELVPSTVAVSTIAAGDGGGVVGKGRTRVVGSLFRLGFYSQTLRGLQRRGQGFRAGLGTVELGLQTAIQIFQLGTTFVRTGRQTGGSRISLIFIHEWNHPTAAVILPRCPSGVLSAGEFDFAFGFGGHPVAGCGTISPHAHSLQDTTVTGDPGALQNKRSVNPPVNSNDEADFYSSAVG